MEEIIKRCKCGVFLSVNEYRDYYDTITDAVKEHKERNLGDISSDLEARIIAADTLYELQFYPDTPVGFHVVYGTSLDEVVEGAKVILNRSI